MAKITLEVPKGCQIIHFHLKYRYYDMIISGEKNEEYREINDYYRKRFDKLNFQKKMFACFWKGYTKEHFYCEIKKIFYGFPLPEWSDEQTISSKKLCYVIQLND